MRGKRVYVYWARPSAHTWKAFYQGRVAFIDEWESGYIVSNGEFKPIRDVPYPSLNLAKRAGSKWLRGQERWNQGERIAAGKVMEGG